MRRGRVPRALFHEVEAPLRNLPALIADVERGLPQNARGGLHSERKKLDAGVVDIPEPARPVQGDAAQELLVLPGLLLRARGDEHGLLVLPVRECREGERRHGSSGGGGGGGVVAR